VTTSTPPSSVTALRQPRELQVDGLDRDHRGVEVPGVPDHVAVGVVDAGDRDGAGAQRRASSVGDLGGLHPRPLLERHAVLGTST
jgi:hypothetical protein